MADGSYLARPAPSGLADAVAGAAGKAVEKAADTLLPRSAQGRPDED